MASQAVRARSVSKAGGRGHDASSTRKGAGAVCSPSRAPGRPALCYAVAALLWLLASACTSIQPAAEPRADGPSTGRTPAAVGVDGPTAHDCATAEAQHYRTSDEPPPESELEVLDPEDRPHGDDLDAHAVALPALPRLVARYARAVLRSVAGVSIPHVVTSTALPRGPPVARC